VATAGPARAVFLTALTSEGALYNLDSAAPGTPIGALVPVTGLVSGQSLVAIDYRASDGALLGLGYNSSTGAASVYSIAAGGAATQLNMANVLALGAGLTQVHIDINPVPNALRVTTNAATGNNLRITMGGAGTVFTDGNLNSAIPAAVPPNITGTAYTNNVSPTPGSTTLFVINETNNSLMTQSLPNDGTLINPVGLTGITGSDVTGFDISGASTAFLSSFQNLFSFDLGTGAATNLGSFAPNLRIIDITAPPVNLAVVPAPGTLALAGGGRSHRSGRRRPARSPPAPRSTDYAAANAGSPCTSRARLR
jgi:hypothetical protein